MATRIAWLLNLDAERELEAPRQYQLEPSIAARITELRARMTLLLTPGDVILPAPAPPAACALAFCPTPSALARIVAAGLAPPTAPSLEVLQRVNSRAFCAELGQTLPGARYVRSLDELHALLQAAPPTSSWIAKRDFSFAGRERRRIDGRTLDAPTAGFVRRSFARGQGLQLEPWLPRSADFAQHGYLTPAGQLLVGEPLSQQCDLRGAWQSSRAAAPGELRDEERAALAHSLAISADALFRAGYFGPFGVDAYRYRDPERGEAFQPRSEINARFSMGFPRALLERALAHGACTTPA